MTDTSSLVLAVDATQVRAGATSLDDLARAGGKAEVATTSLSKATDILATAAKAAAAAFGSFKVLEFAKDAAMLAARFETMGVVMRIAGNNAGYTMAQMEGFSKSLQKSGISMLQSRDALTQLATANIDLANATKLGRAAQDLAVVGGINSSEALGRLIHGIKSGQTETLRTIGLNVSFEAGYKKMATTLGTTSEKLTEQQKVLARTNIAMAEAARYQGIYEESMTTAGKAMTSLTRYWEDLKIKIGEAALPTLAAGVFALTDALKAMNEALDTAGRDGTISLVADALKGTFRTALETVAVLAANFAYTIQGVGRSIGGLLAIIAASSPAASASIWKQMGEDSDEARTKLDAFEKKMLGAAPTIVATAKLSEAARIAAGKASRDAAEAAEKAAAAAEKAAKEYASAAKSAREYSQTLQDETQEVGLNKEQVKMLAAARHAAKAPSEALRMEIMKQAVALHDATAAEVAATAAQKKALEADQDGFKAMNDLRLASEKQVETASEMLNQIEFETSLLTLNTEQRSIATMERELERQGIVKGTAAYEDYIVKLREAMSIKSGKEAGIKAVDDLAKANQSAAEASGKYWEDALMRAFESGKGFFQSLWDTIKNTLKTQVLKVAVQGVMGSLGLGAAGSAMAGSGGGGSGLFSGAGMLSGLGLAASSFGAAASTTASAIYANGILGVGEAVTGGFAALTEGTMASFMSGAGTIVGALGPIAIGIAALVAISKATSGEMRSGGQYSYNPITGTRFTAGPSGGQINAPEVTKAISGTVDTINKLLSGVGSASRIAGFQAGLESSGDNRGGAMAGGTLTGGATFGQSGRGSVYDGTLFDSSKGFNLDAKQAVEAFGLELQQSVIEALQASTDIPRTISDMVSGVVATTLDAAGTAGLLTAIDAVVTGVNSFNAAAKTLPFENLKNLSFDTAAGLIAASGGMEKLGVNLSTYYTAFYSAEEQRNQSIKNINATLAAAGIVGFDAATATREYYKSLVEGQHLSDASGQKAYAALVSVAGAFDQVTSSAQAASSGVSATLGAAAKVTSVLRSIGNDVKAFADAASAAHDNLVGTRLSISEALWAAQDRVTELQKQAADGLRTFTRSIDDFLVTINPATGSSASLASLKAQLSATAVLAAGGDTGAQGKLIAQAQAVLKAAEASSTDRVQYARSEAFIRSTLATVKKAVDPTPIVAAVAVAIVDPMNAAKDELKVAQKAVVDYSLLARTSGAVTDRSVRMVAGSVTDLASAYSSALVKSVDAQHNFNEAVRVTTGLQLTTSGSFDALIADLASLDAANAALTAAAGELAIELGQPGMSAIALAKHLGLAGSAAAAFVKMLNDALKKTGVVSPPDTSQSITSSGGAITDAQTVSMTDAVAALNTAVGTGATAGQIVNAANVNLGFSATDIALVGAAAGNNEIIAAANYANSTIEASGGTIMGAQAFMASQLQSILYEYASIYSADQLIAAAGANLGISEADVRAAGQSLGLVGYATGTNFMQQDGPIYAHAGETITPKPYVDIERSSRAETNALMERLVASNERLEAKVAALQMAAEATAKNTEESSKTLTVVTRGGRAMQTEAFV